MCQAFHWTQRKKGQVRVKGCVGFPEGRKESLHSREWATTRGAKRSSFFYSWRKIAVVFPAHMSLSGRQRDYPRGNKMETRESSIFSYSTPCDEELIKSVITEKKMSSRSTIAFFCELRSFATALWRPTGRYLGHAFCMNAYKIWVVFFRYSLR